MIPQPEMTPALFQTPAPKEHMLLLLKRLMQALNGTAAWLCVQEAQVASLSIVCAVGQNHNPPMDWVPFPEPAPPLEFRIQPGTGHPLQRSGHLLAAVHLQSGAVFVSSPDAFRTDGFTLKKVQRILMALQAHVHPQTALSLPPSTPELFQTMLEHLPDPVLLCDPVRNELHLRYMNPAAQGFGGNRAGPSKTLLEFLAVVCDHKPDRLLKKLAQGEAFQTTFTAHCVLGNPLWVQAQGQILPDDLWLLTFKDVTFQTLQQQAIERSRQASGLIFQQSQHPMWIYRMEDQRILQANGAALKWFGCSLEQMLQGTNNDLPNTENVQVPLLFNQEETVLVMVTQTSKPLPEDHLRRAEHVLQRIANNSLSLIAMFNARNEPLSFSPSCEDILGHNGPELMALGWDVCHPADTELLKQQLWEAVVSHKDSFQAEHRLKHRNGSWRWMSTSFSLLHDLQGHYSGFVASSIDITEQRVTQQELSNALEQTRQMVRLTAELEHAADLTGVMDVVLTQRLDCLPFDYGLFVRFRGQGYEIKHPTRLQGKTFTEMLKEHIDHLQNQPFQEVLQGNPMVYSTIERWFRPCALQEALHPHDVLVLPVLLNENLYGTLVLGFNQTFHIQHHTLELLNAIRDRASHVSERMLHLEQISESREETLRTLGMALEYRDYETKGHTDRVVDLSLKLGERLGLNAKEMDALRWGAYLHDTGKIAIPDHILLKPAKLTREEFEQVKKHSEIGFDMLKNIPNLPTETLEVVLHHHEKWDGSGYPKNLQKHDIPYLARIFTVVDVYDALVSKRPYKEPFAHEAALQEIQSCSGSMFDPEVVEVFLKLDFKRV
ncbi:HD domain-containing phosphohydrolase [Deinococcus misasensis]|uniref:HD domain-containing phosphohydrolase n=1 Tax=Deinococcus misasensis TaxID=392413 RepID=UPI00068F37B3|nr:HD domain-containing phosphohydrolase [Deinococcus misasensis]